MSWNGSGTFSRIHDWVTDKAGAVGIVATRHDAEDDSFASGIQLCITKDGQSKMTSALSPNADASYSLGSASLKWINAFLSGAIKFVGTNFTTDVAYTDPTANRTITIPDDTGTVALTKDVLALAGGTMTGTLVQAKGGDLASANPLVIDSDGNYFDVTGTTNFASMTVGAGTFFTLQFDGILTMTHHATNLDLPGEANITTAAGDSMICFATASNAVHVISYTRADGKPVVASNTPAFTASFTSSEQTISAAGFLVLAHSLGAMPALVQIRMICKTAELGYSIGDEVILEPGIPTATVNSGIAVQLDATNVSIQIGNVAAPIYLVHQTTAGNLSAVTNANWKIIARAWA